MKQGTLIQIVNNVYLYNKNDGPINSSDSLKKQYRNKAGNTAQVFVNLS